MQRSTTRLIAVAALLALATWLSWPRSTAAPDVPASLQARGSWQLRVCASDFEGQAVPGATVEVRPGEAAERPLPGGGSETVWLGPAAGAPLQTAITDAAGQCALQVDRPRVYVSAARAGYGRSVAMPVDRSGAADPELVHLQLHWPVVAHGRVIGANGQPVPFAQVHIDSPFREILQLATAAPVAGADGRFRFEGMSAFCRLRAEVDGESSMSVVARLLDAAEIVVPFAGAIRIAGRVVDEGGAPVRGARVDVAADAPRSVLEGLGPQTGPEARVSCDPVTAAANGSFTVLMSAYGRFYVNASDPEQPLRRAIEVEVSTSPQAAHAEVELRLLAPQSIRGRVRDRDGAPIIDVRIQARQVDAVREASTLPEPGRELQTAADGSFAMQVAAGSRWQLQARNGDGGASCEASAGANDIDLVLQPMPAGGGLRGEVVRDTDNQPVTDFQLRWMRQPADPLSGWSFAHVDIEQSGNRFFSKTIPTGDGWRLAVTPGDRRLVASNLGPWPPAAAEQQVVVRLQAMGEVAVRVVGRGGVPLRGLMVRARSHQDALVFGLAPTDAEGRVRLAMPPGRTAVVVARGCDVLVVREVMVVPGSNVEFVVAVEL